MSDSLFAIRLHEARLAMQLSMDKLVDLLGGSVTKQSISRYERGVMRPKYDVLRALASALGVSEEYFDGTNLRIDIPMLRATSNNMLTEKELISMEAKLSFWMERYLAKEKKADYHTSFNNPVAGTAVSTLDDAVQAADLLRERWHCGNGPLPYLLRLLERKGIKILLTELPEGILGLSTWADKSCPLIVLDTRPEKTTTEQIRFTAAHELAHLLLTLPEAELSIEKRCNKFASFFLFPAQTFVEEMGNSRRKKITLEEMIDLKDLYGISIAAQVHEAWDIGMISRQHYDWWYDEKISKNRKEIGWGNYPLQETIGRERRIEVIVDIKNPTVKDDGET